MNKLSLLLLSLFAATSALAASPAAPAPSQTLLYGVTLQTIKEGTGAQPTRQDAVKVNYRGTLADGTEFDSSYKRGQPAVFRLAQVVPCWTEGMQRIKVGGKAKLTCPSATAYGARGVPGLIPPDSTLTFEVELLDIVR